MKKKLLTLLAFVMAAMTAGAFTLTTGTSEHGTLEFQVGGTAVTTADEGDVVTVICTPATGYVANQPSGEWSAGAALARRVQSGIGFLEPDFTLTPVEGEENQWTFTMEAANATVSMSYKKLLSNTDISIAAITALTYTGQALTPTLTVQDGSTVLTLNTDYTVTYSNNVNVALSTAGTNAPTVTITAAANSENYAGTATKTFTISPKALEASFIGDIAALTYNRQAQTPEPVVSYNGMTLVKGTDYTVSYANNTNAALATAATAPTVTVTAVANGNYSGSAQKTFTINRKNVENSMIQAIADQAWTGSAITPAVTVNDGSAVLTSPAEYTVAYSNNTANGDQTAVATITGQGNYQGTATANFSIRKDFSIASANFQLRPIGTVTYNGIPQEPVVEVRENKTVLVLGTDYTVSYSDNTDAGIATATVTGIGKYSGTLSRNFTVNAYDISEIAAASMTASKTFTGSPIEPTAEDITITFTKGDGTTYDLIVDQDFYISDVTNNTNVGTATVNVEGIGNFIADRDFTFEVTAKDVADDDVTIADLNALTYDGTAKKPALTVKFGNVTLAAGTDYTVAYTDSINAGTATATITGKGNYTGTKSKNYTINKANVNVTAPTAIAGLVYNETAQTLLNAATVTGEGDMSDVQIKYSLTPNDDSSWTDAVSQGTNAGSYDVWYKVIGGANHNDVAPAKVVGTIAKAALTTAVLTTETQTFTYDMTEHTAVVATVSAGTLTVPATSYTVSGDKQTNVGTYTVTVTANAESNFSGTATATFSITEADANNNFAITLVENSYVYDGTQKTPTVTVKDGETTLTNGTDYTFAFEQTVRINVGTYKVTVTGKGNYAGTKEATFTITKANSSVTTAPTKNDQTVNLNADGSYVVYNLVNAGTAAGGTMMYSVDNGVTWSEVIPTQYNAGTYDVLYKVAGDSNHNDATDDSWKVTTTISKAQATMAFSEANYNLTYGDAPFTNGINVWGKNEIHYISSEPRVAQVHYFTGAVTIVGAGTATITAKMIDHQNFYPAADISYTVTVAARQVGDDDVVVGDSDAQGVPVITASVQAPVGTLLPAVTDDYTLDYYTSEEDPNQRTLVTREQMIAAPGQYYAVLTFFGNYAGYIEKLITVENKQLVVGDITGPDGTSDGVVDADDVDLFIAQLLNDELPEAGDPMFAAYDVNGDGKLDIADAQGILNIANGLNWNGSLPNSAGVRGYVSENPKAVYSVSASNLGGGTVRYTVSIEGNFSYTGFQMDAKGSVEFLGEGNQAVANMRSNTMKNGTRRVVGYGDIEANATGMMLYIDVQGDSSVDIDNVILTTADSKSVRATLGTTTGISIANAANEADEAWYDLGGRKVNSQTKNGVFIVNGKKVVIK